MLPYSKNILDKISFEAIFMVSNIYKVSSIKKWGFDVDGCFVNFDEIDWPYKPFILQPAFYDLYFTKKEGWSSSDSGR